MHAPPTVTPGIRSSADAPTASTPAEVPGCPATRIAQQAAREATRAADTAMRAAARSTAANSARLDTIMFEAHQAATDAERYARLAAEEERAGNPATGRNFTALAIARAVDAQRTAGVPCTAEALAALIERQRTEAEIQEEARAERERDAAYEAEQRATTGMDADNRVRLEVAKSTARQEVPSWGWSQGMLRAMEAAQARKLYRRDGYAWQSRDPGQFTGGRRVARERVLMLASAGFLAVGRGADRAITMTPMGETALYLAQLHPDGLHPDDRTAHQARLAAGRRRGRSRDEVKAAARRLRPLDRHFLRSFKRPVTLAEQNARAALEAEQTWESDGGAICEPRRPQPPNRAVSRQLSFSLRHQPSADAPRPETP
ncbi:hypothetical protein GA0115259_1039910 [Streptomyces sp. MnatMP-M17]|nr:hypothetical protein GA0115259_1039910 [Streptomyces sp. MnatMP-M17]